LFFKVNLYLLITACALALFQAFDRYLKLAVTFFVARMKMPILIIVSITVASFQPITVIKVATATSGFVVAAAAKLLFQEIQRAQNFLRRFAQKVRFL